MSIGDYLKETHGEMKHVSWPTRKQAIGFTVVVIIISLLTAVLLGLFDFVFQTVVDIIVGIFI